MYISVHSKYTIYVQHFMIFGIVSLIHIVFNFVGTTLFNIDTPLKYGVCMCRNVCRTLYVVFN